jgi:hypothetical protein
LARKPPTELPSVIPIFPLQGALLLPKGQLPLNIFEPRYVAMTEDAIAGDRLIGMIQPRVKEKAEPGDAPDIYRVGCVGRIASFSETSDGRYLISLVGLCRFRVAKELPQLRGYRRVEADYAPFAVDFEAAPEEKAARDRLLAALRRYLDARGLQADWDAISETETDELVAVLAMLCPFGATEKQALLEAEGPEQRAQVLITLLQMGACGAKDRGAGPWH